MALAEQTEFAFMQQGGLKDEGGTKDPVSGNDVPSGIYYYVVSNGKYKEARTMTLLK